MSPSAKAHIDNLRPYKGGNQLLWRIHELDNIDKHRTLFTAAHDLLLVADWMPDKLPYRLKTGDPQFGGLFDVDVANRLQDEIEEAVNKAKVTKDDALLPSLRSLVEETEELILNFKPMLNSNPGKP
jgi:hypothetical protein